ncbi:MAG: outer membrane protein transport protein [Deltaproteobacteria bacterium]|nr:outer membrane protein transport protein [Deltaproteobacteria bacterium]MCL5277727.1 outer membrane protein transport protein [Deltaproteobacteria bacterium]
MRRLNCIIGFMLAAVFVFPAAALSDGYTTPWLGGPLQGPAIASGAGVYWNPAAIGAIRRNSLFFTLEPAYEGVSYQRFGTDPYNNNLPYPKIGFGTWAPLPSLALTFKLPKGFSTGLGLYAPYARVAYWPKDGPERFNGSQENMVMFNISPLLAYKVTPKLFVGAEWNVSTAYLDVYQSTTMDMQNPSDENPEYEAKVHLKNNMATSYGFTIGLYYEPTPIFTFGISYMSSVHYLLQGTSDISTQLVGNITADTKLDVTMPQTLNFGMHFLPAKNWMVDVTYQYINWSEYKNIKVQTYNASNPLADKTIYMLTGLEDVLDGKIWTGYTGFKDWLLAGGVGYDPSSFPENHIYSLNIDFTRMDVFLGAEYTVTPSIKVGLMADHAISPNITVTDSIAQPTANGLYTIEMDKITILLDYRF